jgi:hypothetical protein
MEKWRETSNERQNYPLKERHERIGGPNTEGKEGVRKRKKERWRSVCCLYVCRMGGCARGLYHIYAIALLVTTVPEYDGK